MVVPEDMVAMSEYVHVGTSSDIIITGNHCSIMFIVDVSQSNRADKTDEMGGRFQVLHSVLDSICNRNPNVQVGMVFLSSELYFNPADDNLFEKASGYLGGYIPLLELGKMYRGQYRTTSGGKVNSKESYNKKGIDVLKMYLQIKNGFWGGNIPKYEPPYEIEVGTWKKKPYGAHILTKITAPFDGAKEALSTSEHAKDKRFFIFFSDGYATEPSTNPAEMNRYIQGVDVPTTFAIYNEPISTALTTLNQMTSNIKNNGYSASNPELTNLWDMIIYHDNLVALIIEKIIKKIITSSTTFTTTDIEVNGLKPVAGWDSTGFFFDNLFPLTGLVTTFAYDITYHVKKDSIDGADTITVKEYDTTLYYNHKVKVSQGEEAEDSLKLTYWGRNLTFYYNGTKLSEIGRDHEKIEIHFSPYEIDTFYTYDSVSILLTTSEGNDREELVLKKSGTYFSAEIERTIAAATVGDGTIQHKNPDTLMALFRNRALPLDTLEVAIAYFEGDFYRIDSVVYYDRNVDGFVDRLTIDLSMDISSVAYEKLADKLQLCERRALDIQGVSYSSETLVLAVDEQSGVCTTSVSADDLVRLNDTILLTEKHRLIPGEIVVSDSLAPVIESATYDKWDKREDTLRVQFREDLDKTGTETPSSLTDAQGVLKYRLKLGSGSITGNSVIYAVKGAFSASADDSIRIALDSDVFDRLQNEQVIEDNRTVALQMKFFIEESITTAAYFDTSRVADGYIDRIALTLSAALPKHIVTSVLKILTLPEECYF